MLSTFALAFALSFSPLACGDKDDDTATSQDGGAATDGGSTSDGGSASDGGAAGDGGSAGDGGTSAGDGGAASDTAYSECSSSECSANEDCLGLSGLDNLPFCSPQCGDGSACPDLEGAEGMCALSQDGESATNCVLVCSLSDLACPTGMECVDVGQDEIGLCLWPA